jgi:hypothetical protein
MTIDEEAFQTKMVDYLREVNPSFDEAKVQRLATLGADVIQIMNVSAFKNEKHTWETEEWIVERLKEFNRVKPDDTDIDLRWAVGAPLNLGRLVGKQFEEDRPVKFVYSIYFKMSDLDKPKQQPAPTPVKSQYKNPFE